MPTIAKRTISAKSLPKPHSKASKSRGRQLIGKVLNDILLSSDPMTAIEQSDLAFLKDPQKLADFISAGGTTVECYVYKSLFWMRRPDGKYSWSDSSGGSVLNYIVDRFVKYRQRKNNNDPDLITVADREVLIVNRKDILAVTNVSVDQLRRALEILKLKKIIWTEQYRSPYTGKKAMYIFLNWDALTFTIGELFLLQPVHPNLQYIVVSMIKNVQQNGVKNSVFVDILKKLAANRFPPKPKTAQLQKQTRKIYRAQRQNPQLCIT